MNVECGTRSEETPPNPRKRGRADAQPGPTPRRWDDFAAIYPPHRIHPDTAARKWWAKNAVTDEVVDRILDSVRGWLKSAQWQDGVVPNCSKFLDEGIWKGAPGPPRIGQSEKLQSVNARHSAEFLSMMRGLNPDKEVANG